MAPTIRELLAHSRQQLAAAPHRPPAREAALLLGFVLEYSEPQLLAHDTDEVGVAEMERFEHLLARRLAGEPVAYLTGVREFYGRAFHVDDRVLIPRPETEHLVAACLALELASNARILDVGTGSGCVAVTLACELPEARVSATDAELGALMVAAGNATRLGVRNRVALVRTNLAAGVLLESIDAVVANLPYLSPDDALEISSEISDYEPHRALFAPDGGLAAISRLLEQLEPLRDAIPVALEIGKDQAPSVQQLATEHGFRIETVQRDYSGHDRVVVLRRRRD